MKSRLSVNGTSVALRQIRLGRGGGGRRPRLCERRQNRRVLTRLRRHVTSLCAFVQLCASGGGVASATIFDRVGELPKEDISDGDTHQVAQSCRSPPSATLATVATHFGFSVAACRAGSGRWRPLCNAALQLMSSSFPGVEEATSIVESPTLEPAPTPAVTMTEFSTATEAEPKWNVRCDTEAAICLSLFNAMSASCDCDGECGCSCSSASASTRLAKGRRLRGARAGAGGDLVSGGVETIGGGLRGRRRRQQPRRQQRRSRLTNFETAAADTWDLPQSTNGTIEWPAEPDNPTTKHDESPMTSSATPTADRDLTEAEEETREVAVAVAAGPSTDFGGHINSSGENHVTVGRQSQAPTPAPRGLRGFRRRCLALTERLRSALAPTPSGLGNGTRVLDHQGEGAGMTLDCRESADTLSCVDIAERVRGCPGDLPGGRGDVTADSGGFSALVSGKAASIQIPHRRSKQLLKLARTTKSRRGS